MTKYILHGGAIGNKTQDNKKFFIEIAKSLSKNANILCVYFSKDKNQWPELFEQDKNNFSSASPQKVFNFILADDKKFILTNQIKEAEAIYFLGGNTDNIKAIIGNVENLKELLNGKIVAGESAGVNFLSKYFYSNRIENVSEGLGILPIKTFCHYTEEKSDKLERLKSHGEELKVYTIPEEKFFIINQ